MITVETIRRIVANLPGALEAPSYGTPGFKARKKLFARIHQKEDAIVVLLQSIEHRDALIARDPMTYFITDHYENAGIVLVRPTVDEREFRDLLIHAWRQVAAKQDIEAYEGQS